MRLHLVVYAALCLLLKTVATGGLPPLTQQEVVRIANDFATEHGLCVTCYKPPVVRYHKAKGGNYWSVYYAPIPGMKGTVAVESDFSVRVDEASRTASRDLLR